MSQNSCLLCGLGFEVVNVRIALVCIVIVGIVFDYADTVSAKSTTSLT